MLYAVSALLTAVICWPLFGGFLLHRDAVATPQSPLTAAAWGVDGAPPRAVPQDAFVALSSQAVDGGLLVAGVIAASLFLAGVGYGRLARRLLPAAGQTGAVAASIVAIWNPFVAERLLQGHWSLLAGYAALGAIVCAVLDVQARPSWRTWAGLAGWFAVAGLTPTGSILALLTAVTVVIGLRTRLGLAAGVVVAWLCSAAPWLLTSAVADAPGGVTGAHAFAPRAEPGLGALGSLLGLGGVWNADAVPASRTGGWALVATTCLLVLVAFGLASTVRSPGPPVTTVALGVLAALTVGLIALGSTSFGLDAFDAVLRTVPGAGLFRDSQKYLALAMPFVSLAVAAAAGRLGEAVPSGFAVAVIALLVVAPLPDLTAGVGGKLRPVDYPADYAAVTARIGHSGSAVAVWPTDTMRDYPWNNGPSLSPLPRMLDAPVVYGGPLVVDGETIDAPTPAAQRVIDALHAHDSARLAQSGVEWIVVEHPSDGFSLGELVYSGADLTVYRLPGARAWPSPGATAWALTGAGHALWFGCLLAGLAALIAAVVARRRREPTAGAAEIVG
ncbi:MAG: hypothetical protein QM658_16865 [Gordonia sp. (in: high G+C Gram-positive bacteria)]